MVTALATTPPAQPARGGGQAGRGCLRGGGQARYYALFARTEAVSSDSIITGDSIIVNRIYQSCLVVLSSFETKADILLLSMVDFDIILGMDWLSPHYVVLDCHAKTMTLARPGLPRLEWRGSLDYVPSKVISFLKAQRMVEKGCAVYIAYVRDVSVDTPTMESVPVVRDYPDVFSVDLPSMPPDRDIDFCIDLLPGTQPIYIPPYCMASPELKELKEQL
ncbi:uncharacterized protein [Nicotiana sylvestris]|uniref:uncharacterized protein n=1 Tax=Nicotiana sylvestris TaxID=4096 RepID=UPI00388CBDCB